MSSQLSVLREAMKLSVSAFRAQATAQRKILKPYQNQLNYGACSSFPTLGIGKVDEVPHMMVDKTGIGSPRTRAPGDESHSSGASSQDEADSSMDRGARARDDDDDEEEEAEEDEDDEEDRLTRRTTTRTSAATSMTTTTMTATGTAATGKPGEDMMMIPDKSPGGTRTKSNQRWMKLRTTVQLSGAISNTIQKSKPPLKREDSFLKRFSTRQIPETQETVDTGDETEPTSGGAQTQDEVNRRRRKRRKELSRTVVNPDENFFFYWLMTVTVCVLYNLWTLIVRQSFPELQSDSSPFWYACDSITDAVFVCDIVVQFRTGYLEQGLMVYDSRKLARHYLKSRAFVLDLLSLIPLDLLQIRVGPNPILRFPRFLKIYRVYNYYYIVESRTVYPNLWRVVNLIHILLILAHWFGCFYYLLSEAEGFQGAWVYPFRQGDDATLTRKYLGSLYWSTLTLTTIGDLPTPETNAEYIFTIVSYLIGVFIFATIVGQVGNVITNRNANRLEFERLLDGAKTYMRHHKVPGGMKRRVLRWYDYSWSRGRIQGGGDINTALGLLPDKLKTELALHVNLSVLKKVTIFQECQPEFLHDLVLKMKAYIFTPGDLICRKGEIAREMFIIADGILDVISETGRVLTTMKAGDFFGEIGILNLDGLNKRTADVRSVGYSELFSLSREDVLTAMKDYPEAQEILQSLGRKRLMEARNASKAHKAQVRASRDHESSGESDTAGKRIVEKLRSDVKGLRNALRRSRRGTRDRGDGEDRPPPSKKQSILRRMSHVQSSDEYEATEQTPIGVGLPLLQRLKLLKEKQERESKKEAPAPVTAPVPVTSTTTMTAAPLPTSVSNTVTTATTIEAEKATSPPPPPQRLVAVTEKEEDESKSAQEPEMPKNPETSIPKVPNGGVATGLQVPKTKWNLLKRPARAVEAEEQKTAPEPATSAPIRSIPNRGVYLSKSDTVLERDETAPASTTSSSSLAVERGKRSRSMSPSDDGKTRARRRTLRSAVEEIIRQSRRRSRSLPEPRMKKYNSIDDLSPEYSGLPFVRKLKILNERQKLAEVNEASGGAEGDVVRSASLDVPDRPVTTTPLTRSRSATSNIDLRSRAMQRRRQDDSFRAAMLDMKQRFISMGSSSSLHSPESNETMERRHLKSILKKLSADEVAEGRSGRAELRKLMRAPTVEGYAARHTKLTKSVTFDQSPTDGTADETNVDDKGAPTSPTAILTLQLSNLSMIPIASPSKGNPDGADLVAQLSRIAGVGADSPHCEDVVNGFRQVVQGHLDVVRGKMQAQANDFQEELRQRDEVIRCLRRKIEELERGPTIDNDRRIPELEENDSLESSDCGVSAFAERRGSLENVRESVELTDLSEIRRGVARLGRNLSVDSGPSRRGRRERRTARGLANRVAEFRRSLSRSSDFVAVEIESSDDPDETTRNADWEMEMLVEELSRRDAGADPEVRRLEDDVNALKRVVREGDLDGFSASELDMLETILEAKDRRISEIASRSCFDIGGAGRPSRIGQAQSFDDVGSTRVRRHKEQQRHQESLDNLLQASSLLRSRVLEPDPRSSLPIIPGALTKASSRMRGSLPTLERRGRRSECLASSMSSSDDAGDVRGSFESVSRLRGVRGLVGEQVPTISRLCEEEDGAGAGAGAPESTSSIHRRGF